MHYLFVLLAVLLAGVVSAAVVYDIPRLRDVTIDGNSADWKEQGLRVEALYEGRGMPRLDAVENARLRLGWDEQGLLVFVTVMDSSVTEESRLDWLWSRDALEFYVADKVGGKDLVQLVIAPGVDPHTPNPRFRAYDNRKSPALKDTPIKCEIGRTVIDGGYCLEVRIPWSTLGVTPEVGREFGFSTMVDLYDSASGNLRNLTWYPKIGAFANSKLLQCLRLAETAGAPVQSVAYADYEHFRRAVVSVFGSADLVGRRVVAQEGKKTVGTGVMVADTRGSHGTMLLPLANARQSFKALTVCVAGQYVLPLTLPDLAAKRQQAVDNANFVFTPSVFNGDTFPVGDFDDPALLDVLLGHYTIHISYYNAACAPVTQAVTPGRYGAVVTITGEGGVTLTRNCTLYRLPDKADLVGQSAKTLNDAADVFSPAIGVSPVVLHEQMQMVNDFTHDALRGKLTRDSAGATFLAWLAETTPGAPAARTLVVEDWLDTMMPRHHPNARMPAGGPSSKSQTVHWFPTRMPTICPSSMMRNRRNAGRWWSCCMAVAPRPRHQPPGIPPWQSAH